MDSLNVSSLARVLSLTLVFSDLFWNTPNIPIVLSLLIEGQVNTEEPKQRRLTAPTAGEARGLYQALHDNLGAPVTMVRYSWNLKLCIRFMSQRSVVFRDRRGGDAGSVLCPEVVYCTAGCIG